MAGVDDYPALGEQATELLGEDFDSPFESNVEEFNKGMRNELLRELKTHLKEHSIVASVQESKDKLIATITSNDILPGGTFSYRFTTPPRSSDMLEISYTYGLFTGSAKHMYGRGALNSFQECQMAVHVDSSYLGEKYIDYLAGSLKAVSGVNSLVSLKCSVGRGGLRCGAEIRGNRANKLSYLSGSWSFPIANTVNTLSAKWDDGVKVAASCFGFINQSTGVGFEVERDFTERKGSLIVGLSHQYDESTKFKLRVNHRGEANAVVLHRWQFNAVLRMGAEVDLLGDKATKTGFSFAFGS